MIVHHTTITVHKNYRLIDPVVLRLAVDKHIHQTKYTILFGLRLVEIKTEKLGGVTVSHILH